MDSSCFGLGELPSQKEMSKLISKIEKQFPNSDSYELEYWMGIALRNYTAWFIRGDERAQYLSKAVQHLERAFDLYDEDVPEMHPTSRPLNRNVIAGEVGSILIDEAAIRDLEKGMLYLEFLFKNTRNYDPYLCSYAEGFYKLKDYDKAAKIGLELVRRAEKYAKRDLGAIPPAPLNIVVKSYRAKAKEAKKNGRTSEAIALLQQLVDMDRATDNDKKILETLQINK